MGNNKIIRGKLPNGIFCITGGINASISFLGTPKESGIFKFEVQASNDSGTDTKEFTLIINEDIPPEITTNSLADGITGKNYLASLTAAGAVPITWTLESGSLPDGLSLNSAGIITGKPTTQGVLHLVLRLRTLQAMTQKNSQL